MEFNLGFFFPTKTSKKLLGRVDHGGEVKER